MFLDVGHYLKLSVFSLCALLTVVYIYEVNMIYGKTFYKPKRSEMSCDTLRATSVISDFILMHHMHADHMQPMR